MIAGAKLKSAIAVLPAGCYQNPTWKGLLYFGRNIAIYLGLLAAVAWVDQPLLLLPLWVLAGLGVSGLFVLGHDAAHGALFRSPRLSYVVGQLALLPSLHAYEVWAVGHNRIHHVHTGCGGIDFVWHPVTLEQYRSLSPFAKLLHRIEWSVWGAGVYYVRAVWWQKMMRLDAPERFRAAFRRDRLIVCLFFVMMTGALLWAGAARYGTLQGAAWMWGKAFLVPWLVWNYFIGFTVYVQHIALDVRWHERSTWTRFKGQVQGTMNLRVPRWYNVFAQNIYLHVPHHVDMRIPFYGLPAAAAALQQHYGDAILNRRLRLRDYLDTTRRCKLYDFERGGWSGYDGSGLAVVSESGTGVL